MHRWRALYLLANAVGKYWRMDYRFIDKRKTLALGVYPDVGLAKSRPRRDKARELLADGIDPAVAKREEKQERADAAANTFEAVARIWLTKTAAKRAEVTQFRITTLLEKDVFSFIGHLPISIIKPRDVLDRVVRKIEARGSIDTSHWAKQICGQIFRYAVAIGLAALKLSPLVFVRPGELRTAEWAEIDLDAADWRIPASKMKMRLIT